MVCHVGTLTGTGTLELHGLGSGLASARANRGWSLFSHESQLLWTLNKNLGTQWCSSTRSSCWLPRPFQKQTGWPGCEPQIFASRPRPFQRLQLVRVNRPLPFFCTSISAEIMNLSVDPFSPQHRIKEVITLLSTEAIKMPGAPGGWKVPKGAVAEGSWVLIATCPLPGSVGISVLVPVKGLPGM